MLNSNLKKTLAALSVGASLVVAVPVQAADGGFYVGASVGQTNLDINGSDIGLTNATIDDSDTGYKVFLGYDFNKNWGIELGYADLGKYDFRGTVSNVNVTGNADVTAYYLAAIGTYPINNDFAVFGKLGVQVQDTSASASSGTVRASASGNETNVLYGLGLKYNFTKQFSVRGEWERFESDSAIDLFSIGVAYKF